MDQLAPYATLVVFGLVCVAFVALLFFLLWIVSSAIDSSRRRAAKAYNDRMAAIYADHVARWGVDVADAIRARRFIMDMPVDALRLVLGEPGDIDEKVTKKKRVETWKYARVGTNRYALRITVEDDRVVGWDDKR